MLLVLEAGLDVDLDMLKLIGMRGIAIAVTGSLAPLGLHSTGHRWSYRVVSWQQPVRPPAAPEAHQVVL